MTARDIPQNGAVLMIVMLRFEGMIRYRPHGLSYNFPPPMTGAEPQGPGSVADRHENQLQICWDRQRRYISPNAGKRGSDVLSLQSSFDLLKQARKVSSGSTWIASLTRFRCKVKALEVHRGLRELGSDEGKGIK